MVTRLIFIFALPLTIFIILGYITQMYELMRGCIKKTLRFTDFRQNFLFVFFFTAILVLNILYSYMYRDFAFIRSIFLLPAAICILQCLVIGIEVCKTYSKHNKIFAGMLTTYAFILCFLYAYDVLLLVNQLQYNIVSLLGSI